jgi:hypothetical protein
MEPAGSERRPPDQKCCGEFARLSPSLGEWSEEGSWHLPYDVITYSCFVVFFKPESRQKGPRYLVLGKLGTR